MLELIYQQLDATKVVAILIGLAVWGFFHAIQQSPCDCKKEGPSWKMPD